MIIEFSLGNYRSFKNLQTLSFRATALVSGNKEVDETNILETDGHRLLKTIGIYGPNASGKTNLVRGLSFFQNMVSNSLDREGILKNYNDFFKLSDDVDEIPASFFQLILLIEGKRFRYGFTVGIDESIHSEWLFGPADKKETFYFKRSGQEIDINKDRFSEASDIPNEKLRKDALFLSFVSSYDGAVSRSVRSFICEKITIESKSNMFPDTLIRSSETNLTLDMITVGKKETVINRMKDAGIFYPDVNVHETEIGKDKYKFIFFHKNIYNKIGEITGTSLFWLDDESEGTQKYFQYIGALDKLFVEGGVYVSDEIDNNFHPSLLQKIVRQFHDSSLNKANAQLLFTSHDTNLMDPEIMRRDQFYFTEKTTTDQTKLYSLADLKGIRNNADFARQYLSGIYGALPMLDGLAGTINHNTSEI